jgi:outer membrane protein TolC
MLDILSFRSTAYGGLGQPTRLKLIRCMALLVAAGAMCWTDAARSQVPTAPPPPTDLSLPQFVRQVLQANKAVRSKRNEQELADAAVSRAGAVFQPQIELTAVNARSRVPNTAEEDLLRQGLGLYDRKGQDYSAGLSSLLPSGAKVEVKGAISRFLTNINENLRGSDANDYKASYGLTVTQPLARDAGVEPTRSRVRVAELDADAARQATADTESSSVADAVLSYLDLGLAQQRLAAWNDKIVMAERLAVDAKLLAKQGRLPETDIWEVENNLARYRAGASEAGQAVVERINKMRGLLLLAAADGWAPLRAADALPQISETRLDLEQDLQTALGKRPDYLMRKLMVEREGVQLVFAQNQKLPRIDLVASYGVNGLAQSIRPSLAFSRTNDFPSWSIGLQVSVPLGENRQAAADLRAARVRKEEALLGLKAVESALANDIDSSHMVIRSSIERHRLFAEIADREGRLAQALRQKLLAGRGDMRELLISEERVINSRTATQEQAVANAKGLALLALARGTLLERFP